MRNILLIILTQVRSKRNPHENLTALALVKKVNKNFILKSVKLILNSPVLSL